MIQIIDPRKGDAEDDASSPKRRSLFALAGSLVAEISLPKLVLAWVLLIGLPGFLLGIVPLVVSAWFGKVSTHASGFFTGIWYVVIVLVLAVLGWLGGKPAFRLFENPGHPAGLRDLSRGASAPPRRVPSQRNRDSQTEYDPSGRRRGVGRADRRRRVWACRGGMAGFALGGESRRPHVTAPSRADRICERGRRHGHLLCLRGPHLGRRRCGNGPTA